MVEINYNRISTKAFYIKFILQCFIILLWGFIKSWHKLFKRYILKMKLDTHFREDPIQLKQ